MATMPPIAEGRHPSTVPASARASTSTDRRRQQRQHHDDGHRPSITTAKCPHVINGSLTGSEHHGDTGVACVRKKPSPLLPGDGLLSCRHEMRGTARIEPGAKGTARTVTASPSSSLFFRHGRTGCPGTFPRLRNSTKFQRKTFQKPARVLHYRHIGGTRCTLKTNSLKARGGCYHDFLSPLDLPEMQLVIELGAAATKSADKTYAIEALRQPSDAQSSAAAPVM
jgi:hypothetical protein